MMDQPMTLAKAQEIAHAVTLGLAKFGAQFSAPYRNPDIQRALVVLANELQSGSAGAAIAAKEAITAANRRAGAAEARLARILKREGIKTDPDVNNDGLKD